MIKYPSTDQFRNAIRDVTHSARYKGMDAEGNAEFYKDYEMTLPTLRFTGTIKVHGTNANLAFNDVDGMWIQSRKNIITMENDNAGYAFFVESIGEEAFKNMFKRYYDQIDTSTNTVSVYSEWAGRSIHKGVAVNNLDKMMYVFGVKVTPNDEEVASYWIDIGEDDFDNDKVHNIKKFGTYDIDIDFNDPSIAQNAIIEMTLGVEDECPVGKFFGFSGVGEGLVFTHLRDDGSVIRFKSKGKKHSVSNTKTLAPIDVEKLRSVQEFVNYAVTDNRLEQGIDAVFTSEGIDPDMPDTGKLLKWMNSDICKEEMDVLVENNLEFRDVVKAVSREVVAWFKEYLDNKAGL